MPGDWPIVTQPRGLNSGQRSQQWGAGLALVRQITQKGEIMYGTCGNIFVNYEPVYIYIYTVIHIF